MKLPTLFTHRFCIIAILIITLCLSCYWFILPCTHVYGTKYVYIDNNDNVDSVFHKLDKVAPYSTLVGARCVAVVFNYKGKNIHSGKFKVDENDNSFSLIRRLKANLQTPVDLVIGNVRTVDKLIGSIDKQIMLDSVELKTFVNNSAFYLFIPNTYEVYWNISIEKLKKKIQQGHDDFWTSKRLNKAQE